MRISCIITIALMLGLIGAGALAHDGATGIVKTRMDAMSDLGKAVKQIAQMIRGKLTYNAQAVKNAAVIIKQHSGSSMLDLFPKNSLQKASQARGEIWSQWDEFKALTTQLEIAANGLEVAADNGPDTSATTQVEEGSLILAEDFDTDIFANMSVADAFKIVAKTCSQCHEKFRLKKE